LTYVADNVLLHGYGGDRYDTPDIVVLLTNSKSKDDIMESTRRLKERYIKLIIVTVGSKSDNAQLQRIASSPTELNIFKVPGFRQLPGRNNDVAGAMKQACYETAGWSLWSDWSSCSVTCGLGETVRIRRCHHAEMGSNFCQGNWKDTEECFPSECAEEIAENSDMMMDVGASGSSSQWGKWGEWGDWDAWSVWAARRFSCTKKCGGGVWDGLDPELVPAEHNTCNNHACPDWTMWNYWSSCSASCGLGTQAGLENLRSMKK
jgi:hypothetical protein